MIELEYHPGRNTSRTAHFRVKSIEATRWDDILEELPQGSDHLRLMQECRGRYEQLEEESSGMRGGGWVFVGVEGTGLLRAVPLVFKTRAAQSRNPRWREDFRRAVAESERA